MSMRDLGTAELLGADAVGLPGQRRFRLFARTRASSTILWIEKEQLLNLSLVIDRVLAQVSEGRILRTEAQAGGQLPAEGDMPASFPMPAAYDFQVGQIRLSFDGEHNTFVLAAIPFEILEDESGEPHIALHSDDTLTLLFTVEQARRLASRITYLAQSGRPLCPLCHTPLDGAPHACVKQNGHRQIIQILREEDEDEEDEEDEE